MADKVIINPEGLRSGLWVEDETGNITFTTSLDNAKRWDESVVNDVVSNLNSMFDLHLYSGNPVAPPPPPPGL